jgi:hypothetical protein
MLVLVLVPVLVPDYARHHCVPSFIPKHECEQRRQKKKKKKKKKRKRKRERAPSSFSDSSDEGDYKVGGWWGAVFICPFQWEELFCGGALIPCSIALRRLALDC